MLSAFLPKSLQAVLHLPFSQLSEEQVSTIMVDLGLGGLHPDIRVAALKLLQDKGLDTAADAIQHPEAIVQLRNLLKRPVGSISSANRCCDYCASPLVTDGESSFFCSSCGVHH